MTFALQVTLEKVLGITAPGNRALACDPRTGLLAYPAGWETCWFKPWWNIAIPTCFNHPAFASKLWKQFKYWKCKPWKNKLRGVQVSVEDKKCWIAERIWGVLCGLQLRKELNSEISWSAQKVVELSIDKHTLKSLNISSSGIRKLRDSQLKCNQWKQ